jgi:hypothetical protein
MMKHASSGLGIRLLFCACIRTNTTDLEGPCSKVTLHNHIRKAAKIYLHSSCFFKHITGLYNI